MREVLPRLATDRPIWSLRKYEYRESLRTFVMQVGIVDRRNFIRSLEAGTKLDLESTGLINKAVPLDDALNELPGYRFCRLFDPSVPDMVGYGLHYLLVDVPDDVEIVDLARYSYGHGYEQVEGLAPWDRQLRSYLNQLEPRGTNRTVETITRPLQEHGATASYFTAIGKDAIIADSRSNYWCICPERISVIDVLSNAGNETGILKWITKVNIDRDDPMVHFISHAEAVKSAYQEGLPVPRLVLLEAGLLAPVEMAEAMKHIGSMMEMVDQIERTAVHMKMQHRTTEQDYELDFLTVVAAYRTLVHLRDAMLSVMDKMALNMDASVRTMALVIDRWVSGMKSTGSSGLPMTIEEIALRRASQGIPSMPATQTAIQAIRQMTSHLAGLQAWSDGLRFTSDHIMTAIITLLSVYGPTEDILLAAEASKTFPAAY